MQWLCSDFACDTSGFIRSYFGKISFFHSYIWRHVDVTIVTLVIYMYIVPILRPLVHWFHVNVMLWIDEYYLRWVYLYALLYASPESVFWGVCCVYTCSAVLRSSIVTRRTLFEIIPNIWFFYKTMSRNQIRRNYYEMYPDTHFIMRIRIWEKRLDKTRK